VKLQNISWQATIILLATIIIQGVMLFYTMYFGFATGNFSPFFTVFAGSGWFAFIVDRIAKWGKE